MIVFTFSTNKRPTLSQLSMILACVFLHVHYPLVYSVIEMRKEQKDNNTLDKISEASNALN